MQVYGRFKSPTTLHRATPPGEDKEHIFLSLGHVQNLSSYLMSSVEYSFNFIEINVVKNGSEVFVLYYLCNIYLQERSSL